MQCRPRYRRRCQAPARKARPTRDASARPLWPEATHRPDLQLGSSESVAGGPQLHLTRRLSALKDHLGVAIKELPPPLPRVSFLCDELVRFVRARISVPDANDLTFALNLELDSAVGSRDPSALRIRRRHGHHRYIATIRRDRRSIAAQDELR